MEKGKLHVLHVIITLREKNRALSMGREKSQDIQSGKPEKKTNYTSRMKKTTGGVNLPTEGLGGEKEKKYMH